MFFPGQLYFNVGFSASDLFCGLLSTQGYTMLNFHNNCEFSTLSDLCKAVRLIFSLTKLNMFDISEKQDCPI